MICSIKSLHVFTFHISRGMAVIQYRAMEAIRSAKKIMRKEMNSIIDEINCEEKMRQSEAVYGKLLKLPQYQTSNRISLYVSTDSEINTIPILNDIFKSNKEAFIPKYEGKNMAMVKLRSMEDYENLPVTKYNIKQPAADDCDRDDAQKTGGLDLIIIPGVAFSITGKRLGHGMGYYDKFLANCLKSQSHKPHLIAIAFNQQIKDDIPTTENDIQLDMVITENMIDA